MVALLLGLASCSGGGDARELLGNVPVKSQAVVVLNIDKLIKDAGMQADGDKVELSRQLRQLTDNEQVNPLDLLTKGAIRHTAAVFFAVDNNPYMTGFVADEDAFKKFFEDAFEDNFGKESGMDVISKNGSVVAVTEGRFWLTTEEGLSNIRKFMDLQPDDSVDGLPVADQLSSTEQDITAFTSISELMELAQQSGASGAQQFAAMLDKAEYATVNCRFEEGKIVAEAFMYDKNFERVADDGSYFTKINKGTLDCMKGDFEMVAAVGISSKLATQLGALASTMTGEDIPSVNEIDGTIAVAMNPMTTLGSGMPPMMAAIKMKDSEAADALGAYLKMGMGSAMGVSQKGSTLLLRTQDFSGNFAAGQCLADLDGAYFGVVLAPSMLRAAYPDNTIPFKGASFTLRPDDKSIKMELKVLTGSDKNSLATIINLLAAMQKENRL